MFLITHDLDTLHAICDRVAVLADKQGDRGRHDPRAARDATIRGSRNTSTARAGARRKVGFAARARRNGKSVDKPSTGEGIGQGDGNAGKPRLGRGGHPAAARAAGGVLRLAGRSSAAATSKEYDIFFKQSVGGLANGSEVTFSGVPAGQVDDDRAVGARIPSFVRVRIEVDEDMPILVGTTATISGELHRGLDDPARRRGAAARRRSLRDHRVPEGVPVIPPEARRARRDPRQRAAAARAAGDADRPADAAAVGREPGLDHRHPRQHRPDERAARRHGAPRSRATLTELKGTLRAGDRDARRVRRHAAHDRHAARRGRHRASPRELRATLSSAQRRGDRARGDDERRAPRGARDDQTTLPAAERRDPGPARAPARRCAC